MSNIPDLHKAGNVIKEITVFAKELSWQEIGKTALFFNLCILPSLLTIAWIIAK